MISEDHKQAHEVQLTGWGDGHSSGPWVKFRVEPETYEWFKQWNPDGKHQQRFHLVAVPIDDNEEPKPAPKKTFHELSRAQQAGILCGDQTFRGWLAAKFPQTFGAWKEKTPEDASEFVRHFCGVESRKDLDNEIPSMTWDKLVSKYREETQLPEQR